MLIAEEFTNAAVTSPYYVKYLCKIFLEREHEYDQDKEHFWVIGLTPLNTIKYIDLVSLGSPYSTSAYGREVFRHAVSQGAGRVILAHNHPSGDVLPSEADMMVAEALSQAGEIIGIPVLDNVIVSLKVDWFYSWKGSKESEESAERST
jgi:DNA repair protein RadC